MGERSWTRTWRTWRRAAGLAALLAPAAVLAGSPALAFWGRRHAPGDFVAREADRLGLDDATRQAIQKIIDQAEQRAKATRTDLSAQRDKLHALLTAPEVDRDAVMAQAKELDATMAELHHIRLDAMLQIRALLTPAQREALAARHRHGHFHGGPWARCAEDVQGLCGDAAAGVATLRCLSDHYAELSEPCQAGLERIGQAPPATGKDQP